MNMIKYLKKRRIVVFAIILIALPAAISAQVKMKNEISDKTKFMGTIVTTDGRILTFTMGIKGLTSDADGKSDLKILNSKGQEGFQKAIEKQDLGYFALDGQVGQDLNYVTETSTESGTKIIAVFSRWIQPFEIRFGSRSTDYPFTYMEIFIDENGKGTGMIIGAARLQTDKKDPNALDFENFGTFPAKLIGVEMSKKEL